MVICSPVAEPVATAAPESTASRSAASSGRRSGCRSTCGLLATLIAPLASAAAVLARPDMASANTASLSNSSVHASAAISPRSAVRSVPSVTMRRCGRVHSGGMMTSSSFSPLSPSHFTQASK